MPTLIGQTTMGQGKQTGRVHMKTIVFCNLKDDQAYPASGEWYRRQLQDTFGSKMDERVRVYFNENANHTDNYGSAKPQLYIFHGGLEMQVLAYLIDWAEKGIEPPKSSNYVMDEDSQISFTTTDIAKRGGVQPTVALSPSTEEAVVGEPVSFDGVVEIAEGGGSLVRTEWDFIGLGEFAADPEPNMEPTAEYTYTVPGTYFPALRVTARRDQFGDNEFFNVMNMARVRVVVKPSESLSEDGVLKVHANASDDLSAGRIYGETRYVPTGWSDGETEGSLTYADGVYTAQVSGDSVTVIYDTRVWNGYEWIDGEPCESTISAK